MAIELKTPLGSAAARALRAGDMCLLTGELYTARDAAHKRLCALLEAGQPLPFDMRGANVCVKLVNNLFKRLNTPCGICGIGNEPPDCYADDLIDRARHNLKLRLRCGRKA